MALVKCKECGQEVSQKASSCPKCGAPIKKKTSFFTWIVAIVLGFWLIGFLSKQDTSPSSSSSATDTPAPQVPDNPAILKNAKALDEKYGIEAGVKCESGADDYLRSISKYDFKWDDTGFLEQKFDKYLQKVVSPGVFTNVTNKAKLQNGFGAFHHIEILCDFDTQNHKVSRYRFLDQE